MNDINEQMPQEMSRLIVSACSKATGDIETRDVLREFAVATTSRTMEKYCPRAKVGLFPGKEAITKFIMFILDLTPWKDYDERHELCHDMCEWISNILLIIMLQSATPDTEGNVTILGTRLHY